LHNFEIIVGTTLGSSEYAADHLQEHLEKQGFNASIHLTPSLAELLNTGNKNWIICTATHGAGEFPENIVPFVTELTQKQPDLTGINYTIIALGSKSYDQFCNAGHTIDRQLAELNAQKIAVILEICTVEIPIPEDAIDEWLPNWLKNWL